MLPASTGERKERDSRKGRQDGRGVEIQRLIGRSLRAVVDLDALGERSVYVDCDVLQADGGTRCASITGGWVALRLALDSLIDAGRDRPRTPSPTSSPPSRAGSSTARRCATSTTPRIRAPRWTPTSSWRAPEGLVEVQATAEQTPVTKARLDELLALAEPAMATLREAQTAACC